MRRSKYGYLLLALLVITGLAGTINSTSITSKERKFAAGNLKDTKNDVLKTVRGLSKAQLEYKAAPGKWSVKECTYRIAVFEKSLWNLLQKTLKEPANPEKRSEIKYTDEQLIKWVESQLSSGKSGDIFKVDKIPYRNINEAIESFKTTRADNIKYIKGTTENLRNHVLKMPFGWIDCYQLCLVISANSDRYFEQIEEIKTDPNFPSR